MQKTCEPAEPPSRSPSSKGLRRGRPRITRMQRIEECRLPASWFYATKEIRPVFVEEAEEIVVTTVNT